ncbi:hypothetical protein [Rhizobium sp. Root1203]|nr:hypothetical protein [Rhizobium sp. Root1203]
MRSHEGSLAAGTKAPVANSSTIKLSGSQATPQPDSAMALRPMEIVFS